MPDIPPDTVPRDLISFDRMTSGHQFPRDVILLHFVAGATQAQKQAAVDLVRGRVVGGVHLPLRDSIYYDLYVIRIPDEGTDEPILRAFAALRALPQVTLAGPDFMLTNGEVTVAWVGAVPRELQPKTIVPRPDTARCDTPFPDSLARVHRWSRQIRPDRLFQGMIKALQDGSYRVYDVSKRPNGGAFRTTPLALHLTNVTLGAIADPGLVIDVTVTPAGTDSAALTMRAKAVCMVPRYVGEEPSVAAGVLVEEMAQVRLGGLLAEVPR